MSPARKKPRKTYTFKGIPVVAECEWCGDRFPRRRSNAIFCSRTCTTNEAKFRARDGKPRAGPPRPSVWEAELRASRVERAARVYAAEPRLCWELLAERFGVGLHEMSAFQNAVMLRAKAA